MVLKLPWAQKRMFWAFEKVIFQFFPKFWVTKLKRFFEKLRQNFQNCLIQDLFIWSFLKNDFEGTFSSKRNPVCAWKLHFSDSYKFMRQKSETICWESETKRLKLLQWKLGHRKLHRKSLWSYVDLKNKCSEPLERPFYSFLQVSPWPSWNHFQGKWRKAFKTV